MSEIHLSSRHSRLRIGRRYVYVARSRRAGGLAVGINLDPQKTCNFDCVYCEVIDRRGMEKGLGRPPIDPRDVAAEVGDELALLAARPGERLRHLAFAGDGEPSTFPGFLEVSRLVFDARDARGFGELPVVLITNGSGLDRAEMREAHDLFAARGGVFWVKLDAGTEGFYRSVCRTAVPFDRILANLTSAARRHPVVVQSLFFRLSGSGPGDGEIRAWALRLADILAAGGALSRVQVYTIAREPMESDASPLSAPELEAIARAARLAAPGLGIDVYP